MIRRLGISALLLGLAAPSLAHAQNETQLWLAASATYKVSKPLRFSVTLHLRFDDDIARVAATMPEAEVQYRLLPWLRLQAAYRLARERNKDGAFENRHRLTGDVRGLFDMETIRFGYRLRFQETIRPNNNRYAVRNRFQGSYRQFERARPFAALETFHRLGDGESIRLRKYRFTIGSGVPLGGHDVTVFYRIELPQDNPGDPTVHIVGLGYGYDL